MIKTRESNIRDKIDKIRAWDWYRRRIMTHEQILQLADDLDYLLLENFRTSSMNETEKPMPKEGV